MSYQHITERTYRPSKCEWIVIDGNMGFWTEVANASNLESANLLLKQHEDKWLTKTYQRCPNYYSIMKCYQRVISDEKVRQ